MKIYLTGLLTFIAVMANSQGATNMFDKTEEYLNPGAPIKVKAGQTFSIRLASNPTTGYGWQVATSLDDKILLVTNAFIPPDSKLCGAGGHEVWTFKAIAKGPAEISMQYVRPWEKEKPARTNVFTVIVK